MILALGHHPEVLILDEPTSGLDVIVRHEFLEKFIHFACRQGTTILLSSHILEDMERVCDQIGFMDEGRMIFEDSMENIRANFSRQFPERKSGLKEIFISVIHDGFRNEEGKV
jgi:ABC-2 type transport system ATP-binding protein